MLYNLIKNTGKDFQMMTALEMYADDGQHASQAPIGKTKQATR